MRFLGNKFFVIVLLSLVACTSSNKSELKVQSLSLLKQDTIVKLPQRKGRLRVLKVDATVKKIVVKKSEKILLVYFGDTFKSYKIALGLNPIGHKEKQGDNRTPEGSYKIVVKNPNSRGYKSFKISYPNEKDKLNAMKNGWDPGGDICIHGLWWSEQNPLTHWESNWTRGCMALNNQQMDELFPYTKVGTEVQILP